MWMWWSEAEFELTLVMKTSAIVLLCALSVSSQLQPGSDPTRGSAPQGGNARTEHSGHVRLRKDVLERIMVLPVEITNFKTMQFVLTSAFNSALCLTQGQIERVTSAVNQALHEYRTIQGRQFEPIDDAAAFHQALNETPFPRGVFRFRLKPFQSEAASIREKLASEVMQALGPQRARLFWLQGEDFLNSEMPATNHARFVSDVHEFRLSTNDPGPLVDITVRSSGGHHGRPYGEALDPYAPEQLKPILKRWRNWIEEHPRGSHAWNAPARAPLTRRPANYRNAATWDDAAAYVELPQDVVLALNLQGLTEEEDLSPDAVALLGLTTNEVKAVTETYQRSKEQMEQLERANLVRPDPKRTRYILRRFPENAAALRREWRMSLENLLGPNRGRMLDQLVCRPEMPSKPLQGKPPGVRPPWMRTGARWFERGDAQIEFEIETVVRPDGREARKFRYQSDRGENGTFESPQLSIPARFKHLFTPEILELPNAL